MRLVVLTERANRVLGRAAAWLLLASVLVSAVNAVLRKAFSLSSNAMLEAQWYLVGTAVMLGAAWVLQVNGHIRIELMSSRFSSGLRRGIEIAGHALLILPFAGTMLWLSIPYFRRSWAQNESSINTGGLLVWPMRGIICLGFLLLLLQSLACLAHLLLDEEASPDAQDHEHAS